MKQQQESVETVDVSSVLEAVKGSDETDTTKSSRPTSGSDTASSSSTLNDEAESIQYDDAVLTQLARQLEYYFSQANLDKDTYVETLRKLNDSYVPVSILQRFAKVQAFAPMETEDAIIKAATEFSDLLEVVSINTKTGKRVEDADASVATLLAVGTISREPLDNTRLQAVVPSSPKVPVQNTIIIREVDPRVTEEDVRALFDYEHCPPIQSLYLDVYNCWFVTLDTTSRDDMLYVMMQLRSQYLGDEPVKARMKSVVHQVDPTHAPGLPALTPVSSYTHLVNLPQTNESGNNKNSRRKQKKRSKNNAANKNNGGSNQGGKKNGGQNKSNNKDGNNKKAEPQQPKPDLSASSFPALGDANRKVEVVVDGIESTPNAVPSDTCSTATTLSSSSSAGKQQNLGGYAAALLKAKPVEKENTKQTPKKQEKAVKNQEKKGKNTKGQEKKGDSKNNTPPAAKVVVKPPVWGGGRSFADVLAL